MSNREQIEKARFEKEAQKLKANLEKRKKQAKTKEELKNKKQNKSGDE